MKLLFLLLAAVLLKVAASNPQLCYYDQNKLAPDYIIPCYEGSSNNPTYCCKVGSKCMEQSTCYDPGTGVTYQYGCTDPTYSDSSCPKKCDMDRSQSNWMGLVVCDSKWFGHYPGHCGDDCPDHTPWNPALEKPPPVNCSDMDKDDKYLALTAGTKTTLQDLMFLPSATDTAGLSSYFSAHPMQSSTSTTMATVTSITSTTSTASIIKTDPPESGSATVVPTTTSAAEPSESAAAKKKGQALAGGLGAGIPAVLAVAVVVGYLLFKRRQRSRAGAGAGGIADNDDGYGGTGFSKAEYSGEHHVEEIVPGAAEMESPVAPTELAGSTVDDRSPMHSTFSSPTTPNFAGQANRQSHVSAVQPHDSHGNEIHELPA